MFKVGGALAVLVFGVALGQPCAAQEAVDLGAEDLKWAKTPDVLDFVRAFPDAAISAEKEGRVTLRCRISPKGRLEKCEALREEPAGYDFARAAATVARWFVVAPGQEDKGAVTGAPVVITLGFRLPR